MIVIIDNGHGEDTAGKRSPDGRLREYAYAREIAKRLQCALCHELGAGHVFLLTPETNDISLKERCQRANNLCKAHGASNALLVSIHNNAAGADGKWHEASGWSAHVSLNASQNLAICRDTSCPAVLTENLFQDNKEDVDFLLSEEGKQLITKVHVDGILSYIKSMKK